MHFYSNPNLEYIMKNTIWITLLFLLTFVQAKAQTYTEISEKAVEYAKEAKWELAEQSFKEALKLEPGNPKNALLLSNLGIVQQEQKKLQEALESFSLALNITPHNIPILLNRASLCMQTGHESRAYTDYSIVLDLNKDNTEALFFRAYLSMRLEKYKEAEADYLHLIALEPTHSKAKMGLANLYQKQKKYKEGIEIISKLIGEKPDEADYYIVRADIEKEMGHNQLALSDLDEAERISPENNATTICVMRGSIYLEQGQKKLAKKYFEQAISLGIPQAELQKEMEMCN